MHPGHLLYVTLPTAADRCVAARLHDRSSYRACRSSNALMDPTGQADTRSESFTGGG